MNAVKSGYRAFIQEARKTNWSPTLKQKSETIKQNTAIDFDIVKSQKEELGKILIDIPKNKRKNVIDAWQKSFRIQSELAKQKYIGKYIPSLITTTVPIGLSFMTMIVFGPCCDGSFLYTLPFYFSISYGSQQICRQMELKDAYKKEVSTNFLIEIVDLDSEITVPKKKV